jgi:hypothetical protein
MSHALPPYFGGSNLYSAAVTDYTAMAHPLIFAAMTFPVFYGTKNLFTEQPFFFGTQSTIIYGLRFFDLSTAPRANLLWRSQGYFYAIEVVHV